MLSYRVLRPQDYLSTKPLIPTREGASPPQKI